MLLIKTIVVMGALMEAANMDAPPISAKLSIIKLVSKYVLHNCANRIPRNAPATMLGANTPPSPPAPRVTAAASGLSRAKKNKAIKE